MDYIKIKILSEGAKIPTRSHPTDSGLDLYASEDVSVSRGTMIPTGIAVDIPPGFEAQVRPRSGLSVRSSLRVTLGTIDSGFVGEINVIADSINVIGSTMYHVKKGDKIAQLVLSPIETPEVEVVDEFDSESERGENGFGSTGK